MKTKLLLLLVSAGLAITGCSSTQDTTGTTDSDSVSMQDTMLQDTTMVDTATADTTRADSL